jgi:transposase
MSQNFQPCDREQQLLLPPSISDWVPPEHLAQFIVDIVDHFNLESIYSQFRADGKGGAAYQPSMLVALILYSYAIGLRSARQIELSCIECMAPRFITANTVPDHSTISRFRKRFHRQLEELFVQALSLCDKAKLVKLGAVAIDGTKIQASAALDVNFKQEYFQQLAKEILSQAEEIDAAEDLEFGEDKRGDEQPDWMKDPVQRRAKIKALNEELERAKKAADKVDERLKTADDNYEKAKATYKQNKAQGKPAHKPTRTQMVKETMRVNGTDPDSRILKTRTGLIQGYNCQAAVDADTQIILASNVVDEANDRQQLVPMIDQIIDKLSQAGINASEIKAILSDAGYWGHRAIDNALDALNKLSPKSPAELLLAVPPDNQKLDVCDIDAGPPGPDADIYVQHEYKQRCRDGQRIYHKRSRSIESVFGQIKSIRQISRFLQRGMANVKTEWSLTCTTHNLLKLWRHKIRQSTGLKSLNNHLITPLSAI